MDVLRFLGMPYGQWPAISQVAFLIVGGLLLFALLLVATLPFRLWMRRRRRQIEDRRKDASREAQTVDEALREPPSENSV